MVLDLPAAVQQIPVEEIARAPLLSVAVQDGTVIPRGTVYNINACGFVDSARKGNDGYVYMGHEFGNDIVVPKGEPGMGKRHLIIKYSMDGKCYFIKDMGEGTGTFVKIESPFILKHGYIISFGDSHVVINLRFTGKIQLRFLDGPKTDQTLYVFFLTFSTFHTSDNLIKLGRMSDCDIKFDDSSLSRYQCTYC